jgi:hypothetical protein
MSWLKQFAQVASRVLGFVLFGLTTYQQAGGPGSASTTYQKVEGDLNGLFRIITTSEAFTVANPPGSPNGPQKLAVTTPYIQELLHQHVVANLPGQPTLNDVTKAQTAARAIASGLADFLNAYKGVKL